MYVGTWLDCLQPVTAQAAVNTHYTECCDCPKFKKKKFSSAVT